MHVTSWQWAAVMTLICAMGSAEVGAAPKPKKSTSQQKSASVVRGHQKRVAVNEPTRLDWVFPLANQSLADPPAEWLKDYDSTEQHYELFVPTKYNPKQPAPLVLFISPGKEPIGMAVWEQECQRRGMLFASPYGAGNDCPLPRRTRIVLDVLDDIRRRYNIDADRTWIGGFSGGGRAACGIAFALPEVFGGVISVCASGDLREEPWLRRRVMDRLNVAFITGENDFNRGEVERFRGPMLRDVGVPTKTWTFPGMGHSLLPAEGLAEIHDWLEGGTAARRKLATAWPASRISGDAAPSRDQWAQQLLDEAEQRLKSDKSLYDGLMQLQGVSVRWNDTSAGRKARERLVEYDARPEHPWEADDIAEQRKFLIARARATDAYASGPLPEQYKKQQPDMLKAAIQLWRMVIADGVDAEAVKEGEARLPQLERLAGAN
ncbi:MAG TPA: hypothetical protein VHB77_00780 [Planctomycetaceae bacterium]|nr:hypothetical protein [Planctomycetaceae bacterium]